MEVRQYGFGLLHRMCGCIVPIIFDILHGICIFQDQFFLNVDFNANRCHNGKCMLCIRISCFVLDVCGDGYIFFLEKAMHTFQFFSSRLCQINCPEHENNLYPEKNGI